MNDLQFDVDNVHSYESFKQKGLNTNFLTWTALRSSIINMKSKSSYSIHTADSAILWILIISLNLLMHIRQSVNSSILRWYQVKRESRMALKSWQRILSFQMRRKFSLFLILLRAKRMFGRFNTGYWISFCLRTINCSK